MSYVQEHWAMRDFPATDALAVPDGTREQNEAMEQVVSEFETTTKHMHEIVEQFTKEMRRELDQQGATVAVIPSFVIGRPTGQEKGEYLALDLGGTNLRVCQVILLGDGHYQIHQHKYVVSEELKLGHMRHLCDFIADCLCSFLAEYGDPESTQMLDLGFTFSFPILQTSINRGVLKQ
ncbi:unnamed protein product [Umbelopsis ramanniana]